MKHEQRELKLPATGFFYVTQKDGVWWLVNPKGNKFYSTGCFGTVPIEPFYKQHVLDKYGSYDNWTKITGERLKEWGINTVYDIESQDFFPDVPYVVRFKFTKIIVNPNWKYPVWIPDVFDPVWQKAVKKIAKDFACSLKNEKNLIGYFTDNELHWGPDLFSKKTLIEIYMDASREVPGKQKLVSFFRERYKNQVSKFNHIWKMNIKNFDELFDYEKLGRKGWLITWGRAEKDIDDFSRLVAKTYFKLTSSALKDADPNHLNLGVRFHLYGVPREVLEECGKYVDVISINFYQTNVIMYNPLMYLASKIHGCVPLNHWMTNYNQITDKPLLISECTFSSNDGSRPVDVISPTKIVGTQKARANIYEWFARNCLRRPYLIGHHWFLYIDLIDKNMGLVNLWDEPYVPLVKKMSEINHDAINIHEKSHNKLALFKKIPRIISVRKKTSLYNSFIKIIYAKSKLQDESSYDMPIKKSTSYVNNQSKRPLHDKKIVKEKLNDKTIYVDNNSSSLENGSYEQPFLKIQDAIKQARDGDTVFVSDGIYNEKITIAKSIKLIGQSREKTIINGHFDFEKKIFSSKPSNVKNNVITVNADDVTIKDFTITDKTGACYYSATRSCSGVLLSSCNRCKISNNIFKDLGQGGIITIKSNNNIINNNKFDSVWASGLILDNSKNNNINGNIFSCDCLYGIWLLSSKKNIIQSNILMNGNFGCYINRSDNNIIQENHLINNKQRSILLHQSNNNTIKCNNFIGNGGPKTLFYNSRNNWNCNYWGHPKIFPKIIFGKKGEDCSAFDVNLDKNPAKKPHKI